MKQEMFHSKTGNIQIKSEGSTKAKTEKNQKKNRKMCQVTCCLLTNCNPGFPVN